MNDLNPIGCFHKSHPPTIPLFRQPFGFYLIEIFSGLHAVTNYADCLDKHLVKALQVGDGRERPVTRDDLCISRYLRYDRFDVARVTFNVSAARQINERKHAVEELISHMDHVRAGEKYYAVAIGVTVRVMNHTNLFAVEMHRERLVECDDRKRFFRGGWYVSARGLQLTRKALAHIVVSDDGRFRPEPL